MVLYKQLCDKKYMVLVAANEIMDIEKLRNKREIKLFKFGL